MPDLGLLLPTGLVSGERLGTRLEYVLELYSHTSSFGPGAKVAEVWDARNLGWSQYDRIPGKAFCTVPQSSAVLSVLTPLLTHVKVWRLSPTATRCVFAGTYIDSDSSGDDVVLEFFDYLSLLSVSRSGFKTLYPSVPLATGIVVPEWNLARTASSSPLGFVQTGAIENPIALDGVTTITTNSQFGTLDQSRLQLFYDVTEMGRANTGNHVTYEITREEPHLFSFFRNRGTLRDFGMVLRGTVNDYRWLPGWKRYRNDLATIGVAAAGGAAEIVKTDAAEITARGRRQDVFTITTLLGIASGTTEADQQQAVAARELQKAIKQPGGLLIDLVAGALEPFVGWDLGDRTKVEISNGIDSITDTRRIVGVRTVVDEGGEHIGLFVEPLAA